MLTSMQCKSFMSFSVVNRFAGVYPQNFTSVHSETECFFQEDFMNKVLGLHKLVTKMEAGYLLLHNLCSEYLVVGPTMKLDGFRAEVQLLYSEAFQRDFQPPRLHMNILGTKHYFQWKHTKCRALNKFYLKKCLNALLYTRN